MLSKDVNIASTIHGGWLTKLLSFGCCADHCTSTPVDTGELPAWVKTTLKFPPSPPLPPTRRNLYLVAQKGDRILLDLPLLAIRDLVSTARNPWWYF